MVGFLTKDHAICIPHHFIDCEIPPMKLNKFVNYKQHNSEVSKWNVTFPGFPQFREFTHMVKHIGRQKMNFHEQLGIQLFVILILFLSQ